MTKPEKSELTRFIAEKVMGWTWDLYRGGSWLPSTEGPKSILASEFNPTESISDAWMAVDRMRELGWTVEIEAGNKQPEWFVRIGLLRDWHAAETAPLAICLAIQSALGGK